MNVEYCRSICALKYLIAYLNKGKDKAVVGLANRHRNDEITRYQIAKYISTNEGVWRMLQFPIHDHFPAVEQLQVHLEKYQRTLFNVENAPDRAAEPPATTLTGFFELCSMTISQRLCYTSTFRDTTDGSTKSGREESKVTSSPKLTALESQLLFRKHLHGSSEKHRMLSFATSAASRSRTDVFR